MGAVQCVTAVLVSFPAAHSAAGFSEPVCGNSRHVRELGAELQTTRAFRALTNTAPLISLYITATEVCLAEGKEPGAFTG